jgi:type I restriction enzyme S subunit
MKAQPKDSRLDLDYLYRWLQQDVLLRYIESGSDRTAGQDGIRKELVESYPFFLPPLPEQQEIVRRVEDLFAFADRIEARLAVAQKTVDRLTPSVLAKAFRGELVPQDPNDEPASSLLERLRSQPATKPTRKTRKPRK